MGVKKDYNIQAYYKTLMQKTLYIRLLCVSVFMCFILCVAR